MAAALVEAAWNVLGIVGYAARNTPVLREGVWHRLYPGCASVSCVSPYPQVSAVCLKLDGLCHFLLVSIVCWEIRCLLNDFFLIENMLFFLSCYFFKPYFFIFTSQVFDYISWSKFIEVYPVWDLLSFFSTFVYFSKNFKVLSCPFLPRFSQFQHLFLIPGLRWQSFNSVAVVPGYLGATHCPLWASDVSCFLASASPTFLFFWFFSPILFWAHHWRLLNVCFFFFLVVITLVFCFKLSSCYSFTLSVDEEPPVQFAFEDIFFPCDGSFSLRRIILLSVSSRYLCMAFCPSPYFFPASWRVMGSEWWLNPGCLRCEILGLTYSTLAGSLGSAVKGDTWLLPLDLNSWSLLLLLTLGWILEFSLPLGWVLECRLPMCWMVESRLPLC